MATIRELIQEAQRHSLDSEIDSVSVTWEGVKIRVKEKQYNSPIYL